MNWKNILHFVIEEYTRNLKIVFCDLILLCSSFCLLCLVSFYGDGENYSKHAISKYLNGDMDKVGEVIISEYSGETPETDRAILNEIANLEEVKAAGSQMIGFSLEKKGFEELYDIQEKNYKDGDQHADGVNILELSGTLLDLYKIDMEDYTKGKQHTEYEIVLGSNFSDIPLGKVYHQNDNTYEVVGHLTKNSYWLDPDTYYRTDVPYIEPYVCLDNLVIVVDRTGVAGYSLTYLLDDEISFDVFAQKVRKIEEKYGATLEITTLESVLYERNVTEQQLSEYTSRFFPVLVFSVVVITLCIQMTEILKRKRQFGVNLSCGISIREIRKIWMLSYFIKIFVSCSIACFVCDCMIEQASGLPAEMLEQDRIIFFQWTVPKMWLLALILYMLNIIVPAYTISRMKPVELIKGE